MKKSWQPLLELNLATLLVATSAIFGKLVQLSPSTTIFYRCVLAMIFLFFITRFSKTSLRIDLQKHWRFMISGAVFLAFHWITYYMAIRVAGVSVAVLAMFTFPIITTLLEPWYFRTPFSKFNLISSFGIVVGVYLLIPEFNLDNPITWGVVLGVTSAVLYAFRNLISKKYIQVYPGSTILFYQLLIAGIVLIPFPILEGQLPHAHDFGLLLALGLLSTAVGHTLFMRSLKHFSTSTASIISSIQPVYGILMAHLFLGEKVSMSIVFGGAIILLVVMIQNIRQSFKTV